MTPRQPPRPKPEPQTLIEDPNAAESPTATELEVLVGWLDRRTGAAGPLRSLLHKVFPDHWSFLLGELALFCFIILVVTGTFLALFFVPDPHEVTYSGPYAPLRGAQVSAAFNSVMHLSFDVRPGLLVRQMHHWTALIFVASIAVHLCRVFFTAAFRRPRELNWVIGVGLLLVAMAEGLTGYSLPDDLLSGTGIRIFNGVMVGIPFVGPWVANLVFGGAFPGPDIINRLFTIHVLLIPGLLALAVGVHVGLVFLQKHSQYRRGAAREDNVVGLPLWPQQAFRSLGLLLLTGAIGGLLGGLVEINPIWIYGPYQPFTASAPAQPDWYLGWLEGLLRMAPSWEPHVLGITIPEIFLPGLVVPAVAVVLVVLWPWIDAFVSHDHEPHNLLAEWWEQPYRAGVGVGFITLFVVCTLAGGNDVIAAFLDISVQRLTTAFLIVTPIAPIVTGVVAWFIARQRRRVERERGEGIVAHRPSARVLMRNAQGGFDDVEVEL